MADTFVIRLCTVESTKEPYTRAPTIAETLAKFPAPPPTNGPGDTSTEGPTM